MGRIVIYMYLGKYLYKELVFFFLVVFLFYIIFRMRR